MSTDRPNISDWIHYLTSQKNHAYALIVGMFSLVAGLLLIGLWYLEHFLPHGFDIIMFFSLFIAIAINYVIFYPKSILNRPKRLLEEIMDKKKTDVEEIRNEWFRGEKNMNYRTVKWFLMLAGFCLIVLGAVLVFCLYFYGQLDFNLAFALMALGLGLFSLGLAFDSDKKMRALAELNFVEKNATICNYIINPYLGVEDIERIIRDLEAGYKVVDWVKDDKTKINYIDALINLTKRLLDNKILQNIGDDFKVDYKNILENSKRFKHEVNEIEKLQKKF